MTAPKKPYPDTPLPGGWQKIIQVCEDLRDLNTDGYLPGSMILANVKGWTHGVTKGVVCSPFTGNVIGCAFDPNYVAGKGTTVADAYEPKCNGGNDPLPFNSFYTQHNTTGPVQAIVDYGLGKRIKAKTLRRGDYIGLDWQEPKAKPGEKQRYGGHSVFCWDVHLNDKQEVDAFQMLGSNGTISPPGGYGVSIAGCIGEPWFTADGKPAGHLGAGAGNLAKKSGPIFVDTPDTAKRGVWLVLPGVTEAMLDKRFVAAVGAKNICWPGVLTNKWGVSIAAIDCARFNYDGPQCEPYMQTDGTLRGQPPAPAPVSSGPPGHAEVTSTPVKAADLQQSPESIKTVPPLPAAQDPAKPLQSQLDVEAALKEFHAAGWIKNDPGDATSVNDSQTQAALKELQGKLGLKADGIPGPKTMAAINLQLPALTAQLTVQAILAVLKGAGLINADPGPPDHKNNDLVAAAVAEFQGQAGLPKTGVPDVATQAKLQEKLEATAPTSDQQGLNPAVLAVYWMGNTVAPGGTATLRVASLDLKIGQQLNVLLKDAVTKQELDAGVKVAIQGNTSEVKIAIPAAFTSGCILFPRVTGTLDGGKAVNLPGPAPLYVRAAGDTSDALETFFTYKGWIGPAFNKKEGYEKNKAYTYTGYRIPGKTSWFLRGRGNVDVDGAPNAYHPDPKMDKNFVRAGEIPTYDVMSNARPLDCLADGPSGLQKKPGDKNPGPGGHYVQVASDPSPGFLVMATTLRRMKYDPWNPLEWADARVIPFFAIPTQVLFQKNNPSSLPNFGGYQGVATGHTGNYGDYVTAINLNPRKYAKEASYPPDYLELIEIGGKKYPIAHGLIGDAGNQPHIGECSYAFGKALHSLDGPEYADILWMIHPGTGAGPHVIPEPADIKSKGQSIFNDWGGQAQLEKVLGRPELKSNGK